MSGELYDVEDFWRFQLRVGRVVSAERIPRTRKLIKMTVDFGGGDERTVVAGIADQYDPSDLVGRKFIFVTNLKPKRVAGVESQAMLIVAETSGGKVYLIPVPEEVPEGSKVW